MVCTSTVQAPTYTMSVSSTRTENPNRSTAGGTNVTGGIARTASALAIE